MTSTDTAAPERTLDEVLADITAAGPEHCFTCGHRLMPRDPIPHCRECAPAPQPYDPDPPTRRRD